MPAIDPKDYLWRNICSLMGDPEPTVDSVQAKTGVGRGTVQRIKEGQTSVGTDKLTQIAEAFGLEAWQLLVPGLHAPDHLPSDQPFSQEAQRIAHWFDKLPDDLGIRATAENRLMAVAIAALECAKHGLPLGLVQIAAATPHVAPTPAPTPAVKPGKQSA